MLKGVLARNDTHLKVFQNFLEKLWKSLTFTNFSDNNAATQILLIKIVLHIFTVFILDFFDYFDY